jgi:RNA recognition motif-containing protein
VKGFCLLTEESELEEFFKQFGEINSIKIPTGAEFGFVSFKDRDSARKAKEIGNQIPFKGRQLQICFFETKEQR